MDHRLGPDSRIRRQQHGGQRGFAAHMADHEARHADPGHHDHVHPGKHDEDPQGTADAMGDRHDPRDDADRPRAISRGLPPNFNPNSLLLRTIQAFFTTG